MGRKKQRLAAALALLAVLSGCGGGGVETYSEPAAPETALTFFGNKYEPENVTVIEEILTAFMQDHPQIRISYESLKGTEYYDALDKRMSTGNGDDVIMVNHDAVLQLTEADKLADLSGLGTLPDFSDRMMEQMTEGGTVCWVPTTISAFGLYCNLDLLKEHGWQVPENLTEWERICGYFADRGITPIVANNDISLKTLAIGRSFFHLYQSGGQQRAFERINRGEETLSAYLEDGFSLVERFIQRGYLDAELALATKKTSDDLEQFARGVSPFMLTGGWAANRVRALDPGFNFTVVAYPVLEEGSVLVINADTRIAVNAESAHLEEALRFVEYFTQRENIRKFADNQCSFSPLTGGAAASAAEIQPLIDAYQTGRTVIGSDACLRLPIWDWTAECVQRLLAGEPLEGVLAWLDAQAAEGGTA